MMAISTQGIPFVLRALSPSGLFKGYDIGHASLSRWVLNKPPSRSSMHRGLPVEKQGFSSAA
jgi:hypothetical protein